MGDRSGAYVDTTGTFGALAAAAAPVRYRPEGGFRKKAGRLIAAPPGLPSDARAHSIDSAALAPSPVARHARRRKVAFVARGVGDDGRPLYDDLALDTAAIPRLALFFKPRGVVRIVSVKHGKLLGAPAPFS
jgi:hypothetical protein